MFDLSTYHTICTGFDSSDIQIAYLSQLAEIYIKQVTSSTKVMSCAE